MSNSSVADSIDRATEGSTFFIQIFGERVGAISEPPNGLNVNVEIGDTIEIEMLWDVPKDALSSYLAEADTDYWSPEYAIKPTVAIYTFIDEARTTFATTTQFVKDYLISPFWQVQYTDNSNDPNWKNASLYKWVYWMDPSDTYLGINNSGVYWMLFRTVRTDLRYLRVKRDLIQRMRER